MKPTYDPADKVFWFSILTAVFAVVSSFPVQAQQCECNGDVTGDGWITSGDINTVSGCMGHEPMNGCTTSDVDCDEDIDGDDVDIVDCYQGGGSDVQCCAVHYDCNMNDILDSDEIDNGTVLDCNQNGRPDECDGYVPLPYGDIAPLGGSGVVDVDDILRVLDGFIDPASFPETDIEPCDGDGDVDVDDIVTMLGAFNGDPNPCPGPCYQ